MLDERAFLLDSALFLSLGPTLDPAHPNPAESISLTWLDPEGDSPDDEYEFIFTQPARSVKASAQEFERVAWQCMWERAESRPWPTDKKERDKLEQVLLVEYKVE